MTKNLDKLKKEDSSINETDTFVREAIKTLVEGKKSLLVFAETVIDRYTLAKQKMKIAIIWAVVLVAIPFLYGFVAEIVNPGVELYIPGLIDIIYTVIFAHAVVRAIYWFGVRGIFSREVKEALESVSNTIEKQQFLVDLIEKSEEAK